MLDARELHSLQSTGSSAFSGLEVPPRLAEEIRALARRVAQGGLPSHEKLAKMKIGTIKLACDEPWIPGHVAGQLMEASGKAESNTEVEAAWRGLLDAAQRFGKRAPRFSSEGGNGRLPGVVRDEEQDRVLMDAAEAVSFNEPMENAVFNALLEFFSNGEKAEMTTLTNKHKISFTRLDNGIKKARALAAQSGIDLSLLARNGEGGRQFPKPQGAGAGGGAVIRRSPLMR